MKSAPYGLPMSRLTRLLRQAEGRLDHPDLPRRRAVSATSALRFVRDQQTLQQSVQAPEVALQGSRLSAETLLLGLAAATLGYWVQLLRDRADRGKPILWGDDEQAAASGPLLESLLRAVIHDIRGMQVLLALGLTQPLRSVLRNQLEIGLIVLAITMDKDFYLDYSAWTGPVEDSKDGWAKVRPKRAMAAIRSAYDRVGFGTAEQAEFQDFYRRTYEWLSGFEHGHPVALLVSAGSWDKPGTEHDGTATLAVVDAAVWQLYELVTSVTGALFTHHGWRGDGSPLTSAVIHCTHFFQAFAEVVMDDRDSLGPAQ